MFYSPGLLYLHLPRTGGTFVTKILSSSGLGTRAIATEIGGHDGAREVPSRMRDSSLIFGTIRDPWSWYASIDAHYRQKSHLDGFLLEYFGGKNLSFKDSLLGMTNPSTMPSTNQSRSVRPPGCRLPVERFASRLSSAGIGLYTYMILRTYCVEEVELLPGLSRALGGLDSLGIPWEVAALIDTAQLRDGLHSVISAWNPSKGDELGPKIHSEASQNAKGNFKGVLPTGRPDPAIYDSQMIDSVMKSDLFMYELFRYDLPVGAAERKAVTLL